MLNWPSSAKVVDVYIFIVHKLWVITLITLSVKFVLKDTRLVSFLQWMCLLRLFYDADGFFKDLVKPD